MKIKVFKENFISMDGVEKLWKWECPHNGCKVLGRYYSIAVYWENALRGAVQHVNWHRSFHATI